MKDKRHSSSQTDDGSTMLVTVMVMVIVASMLLVAAAVYMSEADLTGKGKKSSVAIMSARSGVTAAVAAIRAARPGADSRYRKTKFNQGDADKLPCGTTLTGSLGGSHASATYSVTMTYYNQDPSNRNSKWLRDNKISCGPGNVLPAATAQQATYVLINSKGTHAGATRAVESVRSLAKLDLRDLGGLVRVRDGNGEQLCWTAPQFRSGLASGQYVTAETCYDKNTSLSAAQKEALKERQTWERRPDNRIMLTFSNDDPRKEPFCVQSNFTALRNRRTYAGVNWTSSNSERYREYLEWWRTNGRYYDRFQRRNVLPGEYGVSPPEHLRRWDTYQRRFYNTYETRVPDEASVMELKACGKDQPTGANRRTSQHFYTEGGHTLMPVDDESRNGTSKSRCIQTATNLVPRLVMGSPCKGDQWFKTNGQRVTFAGQRMEAPVGPGGVDISQTEMGPGEVATGAEAKRLEKQFMLVNYRMMGSCFDVERSWISRQRMIVYPCHVHAYTSQGTYKNQNFFYNKGSQTIYTDMRDVSPSSARHAGRGTSGPWCMRADARDGAPVTPVLCDPNRRQRDTRQWKINGVMDDPAKSFTITHVASGLCMQGAHSRNGDGTPMWATDGGTSGKFTQVVVAKCDGSQLQRWNYEAQVSRHGEKSFREVPQGG